MEKHNIVYYKDRIEITYTEFPTHILLSKERRKKYKEKINYDVNTKTKTVTKELVNASTAGTPRYAKINSQNIYSGNWSKFTRAKIVTFLHEYLEKPFVKNKIKQINFKDCPIEIHFIFGAPLSYGAIKMFKGVLKTPDTITQIWDLDNASYIWFKCFNDVIKNNKILPDDNVTFVSKITTEYDKVESFDDRYLKFTLIFKNNV